MIHAKQKRFTFEKMFFSVVGLYVLFVSLLMVRVAVGLWLFIFFVIVSLFSVYALYKIVYKDDTRKLLWVTLLLEAVLATFLLYPTPLALVADFVGVECSNWSGVPEKCADSISFLSFDPSIFILMIPMVVLAIFSYQKTKQLLHHNYRRGAVESQIPKI